MYKIVDKLKYKFVFQKGDYVRMFRNSLSIMESIKRSFPLYLFLGQFLWHNNIALISVMITLCQYSVRCQKSFLIWFKTDLKIRFLHSQSTSISCRKIIRISLSVFGKDCNECGKGKTTFQWFWETNRCLVTYWEKKNFCQLV